jgi:hypothetical protein
MSSLSSRLYDCKYPHEVTLWASLTIRLAEYVHKLQEGTEESLDTSKQSLDLMETLASRYSSFTSVSPASGSGSGSDIVSQVICIMVYC